MKNIVRNTHHPIASIKLTECGTMINSDVYNTTRIGTACGEDRGVEKFIE